MKKNHILSSFLLFSFFSLLAQQNVGIGTNNPETKLQVNGAISLTPSSANAATNVTIPDNTSVFRLALATGGSTSTLNVTTPKEGQLLTIYNQDDNTANFSGQPISASNGVSSFIYINGSWHLTGSNSIAGPAGPQGPAGAVGAQGPTGATGQQGIQGVAGAVGAQGPAGAVGAQGPTGAQGAVGPAGAAGAQGPAGANGAAGAQGPIGPQGPAGAAGSAGAIGPAGPQGPAGLLSAGNAAGNTTYWDGSTWVTTSNNIYNNGGNVGIGSTSPSSKLEVAATIAHAYPTMAQTFGTLHIKPLSSSTADQSASLTFGAAQNQAGAQAGIYVQSSGSYGTKMYFGTTNSYATGSQSRMMIDHAGNVGIGNIAPSYKLHVSGDILADGGWLRTTGNTGWYNNTYGGGFYMTDATWVRAYNNKSIWSAATIQADGNMYTPIMYDLNNTAYYVDPASQSRFNTLNVSRDNTNECCSGTDNYTLSIAENSAGTARQASISFHNSGEAESFIRLAGGGSGVRAGQRRLFIGDNQSIGTTLQVQGLQGTGSAPVFVDANGVMQRGGNVTGSKIEKLTKIQMSANATHYIIFEDQYVRIGVYRSSDAYYYSLLPKTATAVGYWDFSRDGGGGRLNCGTVNAWAIYTVDWGVNYSGGLTYNINKEGDLSLPSYRVTCHLHDTYNPGRRVSAMVEAWYP